MNEDGDICYYLTRIVAEQIIVSLVGKLVAKYTNIFNHHNLNWL